jgi:hypothetical protein
MALGATGSVLGQDTTYSGTNTAMFCCPTGGPVDQGGICSATDVPNALTLGVCASERPQWAHDFPCIWDSAHGSNHLLSASSVTTHWPYNDTANWTTVSEISVSIPVVFTGPPDVQFAPAARVRWEAEISYAQSASFVYNYMAWIVSVSGSIGPCEYGCTPIHTRRVRRHIVPGNAEKTFWAFDPYLNHGLLPIDTNISLGGDMRRLSGTHTFYRNGNHPFWGLTSVTGQPINMNFKISVQNNHGNNWSTYRHAEVHMVAHPIADGPVFDLPPGFSCYSLDGRIVDNQWVDGRPIIIEEPQPECVGPGEMITLSAVAGGDGPFSYSWRRNGVVVSDGTTGHGSMISGANTDTLVIDNAATEDAGQYEMVVTNSFGFRRSSPTSVTLDCVGFTVTPYSDHTAFIADVPTTLNVIGFDEHAACDGCLTGAEYASQGMTFAHLDELGMNVVQNLVAGSYGPNFVTEACINSAPNAISSSIFVADAGQQSDRFEFTFTTPTLAAGAFIGNLGGGGDPENGTVVEFIGADQSILWSSVVSWNSPGAIFGPTMQIWDNRLFVGITSTTPIASMRILSGPNDGDGIIIDDVQFAIEAPDCRPDLNNDGNLDFFDVAAFLSGFSIADPVTDWNNDTFFDFFDVAAFLADFAAGCP